MSGKQDKKLPSNNHDVDFSVIRTAIQIGGKSIEQILNGVHYGSAEVRHLLMNECDFIIECKVCHNLFRSLPNFVAHKRVYCVEFYEEHKYNLLQKEKEGETIIVQPQPPSPPPPQMLAQNEAGSVMSLNKATFGKNESNVTSSVMDEVLSGKFKGKSQAYELYTQLAEKVEQQKDKRMVKQVTLSPIPSTSFAMRLDMKEVEVEGSSAFIEDKMEVGIDNSQSSDSLLGAKRSHLQRLCEKLAASTGSKIGDESTSTNSHAGNQNFEVSLTKKKNHETRTRSYTPVNHFDVNSSTCTESPSRNHNLEDSPTKRKAHEGRTKRDIPGSRVDVPGSRVDVPGSRVDVMSNVNTESHSGNESSAVASAKRKLHESRTRTGNPDSPVHMNIGTNKKSQYANQSLEVSITKRKVHVARTKKDTLDSNVDGTEIQIDNLSSPRKKKVNVARTRRGTPDSHVDVKDNTENHSENLNSDASPSKRKANEDNIRKDTSDSLVDMNSACTENQSRNQSFGISTTKRKIYEARKDTPDSLDVVNNRSGRNIEEKPKHSTGSPRKSEPQKVFCISPTSASSVASSLANSNNVETKSTCRQVNVILKGEEELNSGSLAKEENITVSEVRNDQRQMHFWQKYCDFEFLTCRLCSAKSADSMALKLHVQEKHDIKFIILQCPLCSKAFFAKNLLTRHLRRTHQKSSYQTSNLLRQVPGIETRGSDISEFNVDMSSVPEGACPLCNKFFTTPHKLTRHMVRFHEKSRGAVRHLLDHAGVLYPTCSLCSKTVLSEYSLERHLERTHGKTREAAKKMMKIDKLKNKLLKEAGTSTTISSTNLFIQNTDIEGKKQPSAIKSSSDKGRGEETSDVLIRLCPGCKREFWKFKTFIRHWPFCARKHNLNRYKDLPQAKALKKGIKSSLSFVKTTVSSEQITDPGAKGLISGEQHEDAALKKMETERTRSLSAERENRSVTNKVSLTHSRLSISPHSSCRVSSSLSGDQELAVPVDTESTLPRLQRRSVSNSRSGDRATSVSTATELASSDKQARLLCSDRSKVVVPRAGSEVKGSNLKPFIAVTSGIGWRTCAGCTCVFAKARTYQKHVRNCKLLKMKRSNKMTTINEKKDSCQKSSVGANDNTKGEGAERSEKPNSSVGLSADRKSFSHPGGKDVVQDRKSVSHPGSKDVVQASTSCEHESSYTNLDETDGMSVIEDNFEEISASDDDDGDWNTNTQSYNSGNTVHTVEEIWVGKQPGRPVEKIKSNRIYVVDRSRTRKSLCQDQKKINAYIDDSNLRCLQCGMEFSHISNVRRHVIRHLGWKRYKCRMCRFSSYNLSECRMHLYRTHSLEMWHSTSSQVEKFVVNLNKEASKVRTMKKQATLRGKRAMEKYEPSPYSLKISQNLPGQRSPNRSSQRQSVDRRKPGVNEQNIKKLNCFNISTRNVTRNFDTRPYAPVDRMSTLVTRKGYYPKSSDGSSPSLSGSQPPASKHARNEDMELSDHSGMILVSTLPEVDPPISQDLPAIEATSASSIPISAASIPVENL
ncbi:hypothetical protein CHS0354_027024 [Potamilus streckersoni]|uniref:C2H2-type domain-containing protein n=1 Tax=Potamilus streckersoni TaxID=2493646 RepID=A0AAE0W4N2_9BIVA|nr:hypothetical protein CHS0354_027024 [Potamilus streckersoni]